MLSKVRMPAPQHYKSSIQPSNHLLPLIWVVDKPNDILSVSPDIMHMLLCSGVDVPGATR